MDVLRAAVDLVVCAVVLRASVFVADERSQNACGVHAAGLTRLAHEVRGVGMAAHVHAVVLARVVPVRARVRLGLRVKRYRRGGQQRKGREHSLLGEHFFEVSLGVITNELLTAGGCG